MTAAVEERIKAVIREEGRKTREYVEALMTNLVIAHEGHPADAAQRLIADVSQLQRSSNPLIRCWLLFDSSQVVVSVLKGACHGKISPRCQFVSTGEVPDLYPGHPGQELVQVLWRDDD